MSNLPIWAAHVKKYGMPPVVNIPKVPYERSQATIDSRQLNEYYEGQAALDEKNFNKRKK